MKFYKVLCQFVKIHTLFTESLEKSLDKVVSRGEKNFSVHRKYMNFLRPRKTALDEPLYKLSAGRSMVEMLGVLAIIGVLSVGAIAGYSKAMFKYKLNKQAEAFNMLLNNSIQISASLPKSTVPGTNISYVEIIAKLNLVPDGFSLYANNNQYLLDNFGNYIWIYAYPDQCGMGYQLKGANRKEICYNLFNVYKQNADLLFKILSDRWSENGDIYTNNATLVGNKYCTPDAKCIKDVTLEDINALCNQCGDSTTGCRLYVTWK